MAEKLTGSAAKFGCPHGYPWADCPTCSVEAVVERDRYRDLLQRIDRDLRLGLGSLPGGMRDELTAALDKEQGPG